MNHSQSPEENHEALLSIEFQSLQFLAFGQLGVVYGIDEERVRKDYHSEGIDIERREFARLGSHTNIMGYLGRAMVASLNVENHFAK